MMKEYSAPIWNFRQLTQSLLIYLYFKYINCFANAQHNGTALWLVDDKND